MKFHRVIVAAAALAVPAASVAQRKEIVELQRDISILQDNVRTLQRSVDEKLAALTMLVQQTLDSANKANTAVAVLESGIRDRLREQEKTVAAPVVGVGAKIDQMAEEFRGVKEAVSDVSSRLTKLQAQVVDVQNAIKVIQAPPAPPPGAASSSGPPPGLSAEALYQSADRDKRAGNLDLALQEYTQYLQYFGETDLAPNAQFHIGEIYYSRGDLSSALKAFDTVLERYPDNNKTPDSVYMKGMCLLKMDQRTAASREFQDLVKKFPRSDAATKARDQLKRLGLPATPATSRKR